MYRHVVISSLAAAAWVLTFMISSTSSGAASRVSSDKMLIVISAPSIHDEYYAKQFKKIIDFDIQFAKTILGNDDVVVLADRDTMPYLSDHLPKNILLQADVPDIWVRDFTTAIPSKMVRFLYQPNYLSKAAASSIQNGFLRFSDSLKLEFDSDSLVLDGGNVVDNDLDKAVVTERVFVDNPTLSRAAVIARLKQKLGVSALAILPEIPGGTTGHADGMVMWLEKDILAVLEYEEPFRSKVLAALRLGLPGVQVVEVPDGYIPSAGGDFDSACGLNVNSLVTNRFIYVPVFGQATDNKFIEIIKRHTTKEIKTVPASNVCLLGGSVRCLSWQVTGSNARAIRDAAARR